MSAPLAIVEKLRATKGTVDSRVTQPVNPDGPEAADTIEALYEALAAMVKWNIKRGPFDEPLGESEQEDEVNTAVAALSKARGEQ